MAKNSLLISEDDRNGGSPHGMLDKPMDDKARKAERSKPKYAPSIKLTAAQVESFGLTEAKVGQKGCALIHYVVKSAASGSEYGDEVPGGDTPPTVSISITHVDPDCEAPADDDEGKEGDGEDDENEEGEEGEGDAKEGDAATEDDDEDTSPKAPEKDTVSPADALGEND